MTKGVTKRDQMFDWNAENIETLKRLWAEGESAAQIASHFGPAVSRSAVIGKVHRLKLGPHSSTVKALAAKLNRVAPPARKPSAPRKPKFAIAGNSMIFQQSDAAPKVAPVNARAWAPLLGAVPVRIENRAPFTCRWPIDVPGEDIAHMCGRAAPGDRYCDVHTDRSAAKERPAADIAADAARREKALDRLLRARAA